MLSQYPFNRRLVLILAAVIVAVVFLYTGVNYVNIDFHLYPRDAKVLDVTDQTLTQKQFDRLRKKLPECDITWNVPLSGGAWRSDAAEITVDTLAPEDVAALAYFTALEAVDARQCRDYEPLLEVLNAYPDLKVQYVVQLGQEQFLPSSRRIVLRDVPEGELFRLQCLRQLEEVICAGGESAPAVQEYCHEAGIAFAVQVGDAVLPENTASAEIVGAGEGQLSLLELLPGLKQLYLKEPQTSAQELLQLKEQLNGTELAWELTVCGITCTSAAVELDLSEGEADLEVLREMLPYFPQAKTLYLGKTGIDNETLAAFREELRSSVKVVWQVSLGDKLTARTDDTSFMPVREHVYYFNDEEAYNLRYCEDMVAVDIGHMSIHNIEFVEFMPNLTYLILAHTQLNYIEPIATCKNLKFLELDWSPLRDLSPLVGCTALEDLNLGMTYASFEPIKQMTWLKNLWVIECNQGVAYQMSQALPDTKVQGSGSATVASGWRKLPNYYAMRDALDMYYMSWG